MAQEGSSSPCWIVKQSQKRLARRTIGLHKLGRHEFNGMALLVELARPVMGPATGLYTDGHRGQLRQKGYQGMARQPLAPHNRSCGVRPHEVEDFLARSMPTVDTFCFIGLVSSRLHDGHLY